MTFSNNFLSRLLLILIPNQLPTNAKGKKAIAVKTVSIVNNPNDKTPMSFMIFITAKKAAAVATNFVRGKPIAVK